MSHTAGNKRKILGNRDETTSQKSHFTQNRDIKKPRTTSATKDREDREETTEEESDLIDIDEYIPSGKTGKSFRTAGSTRKRKKALGRVGDNTHSRLQNPEMSSVEQEASDPTPATNTSNVPKGPHGRPLSREQLRKANHSMIERRRREKMNTAFANLRGMVPGLNAESEGLKGEFKLEVLEKTVEHMRYLIGRVSEFESRDSSLQPPQTAYRRPYHEGNTIAQPTSSADSSDVSDIQTRSVPWQKRKASHEVDATGGQQENSRLRKRSNSPIAKAFQVDASSYSRSVDTERSPYFVTPSLQASRLLASLPSSNINSLLASPAGSRTRSADFTGRDMTRSPFSRADSQATIPEETLPLHDSIHPSLQAHPSELVMAMSLNKAPGQAENTSSAFGGLPSAFFRSAHQRIEQNIVPLPHTGSTPTTEDRPSISTRYRNPDLTLPPPVAMTSPSSPFFPPTFGAEKVSAHFSEGSNQRYTSNNTTTESPFLPPILGTPALFEGALSQHRERHISRASMSSLTSNIPPLGKEEEAAANVLLALSSPEGMTPWQPASQIGQSLASLERWSLDQGTVSQLSSTSEEVAGSRSRSRDFICPDQDANARASDDRLLGPRGQHHSPAADSPLASEQTLSSSVASTSAAATSRMRKTAMDFLDMNRELPGSVVSMQLS
ncbi:hypothetical protein QFC19_001792 [Naganishia cerealis]|uniref:Uncharacterized protein n=1 Tax=Naganishia cerealis TaxID=610337 RepID=A0ACC2WFB5_9TREE|nr:hypothetical protein QFC19_001792 [Naganishia cerealis]